MAWTSNSEPIFDRSEEERHAVSPQDIEQVPLVPLVSRRPGKESSDDHNHTASDDELDEEILGLMTQARLRPSQDDDDDDEAKEHESPHQPLFRDEDMDVDSAAAMVRRVSGEKTDCCLLIASYCELIDKTPLSDRARER